MEEKFIKKVFGITLLVYFASICLVYLVSSKQFHYQETQSDTVSQSQVVGEFAEGDTIKQTFTVDSQYLEGVTVTPATYGKTAEGMLEAKITDANGKNIADIDVDMSELSDNQPYDIKLPEKIKTDNNESYTLELICKSLDGDSQISFYYGNSIKMAKGEISKSYDDSTRVYVNNEGLEGELCLSIDGMNTIWFGNYYWIIMGAIGILLIVYFVVSLNKRKSGKQTVVIAFLDSVSHYKFLIIQLLK